VPDVTGNRTLGDAIRARRTELGLRIEDLAYRSGVAYRTISRIESGYDPQLDTLRRLAVALEVSVGDLVNDSDDTPRAS
jgi:transcriptional regulator with XRE-family HTH domain